MGEQSDVEIVEWMLSREYELSVFAEIGAASKGHLALILLLDESSIDRFPYSCKVVMMTAAAANGHLAVVWFFLEHRPMCSSCEERYDAMEDAAANEHLDFIKYLYDNLKKERKPIVMDIAAANGRLDTVKFLHENRTEGCSRKAMDDAAANGHLDVVKYLHENREEGCTTQAMEKAVTNGHLDVVKYLSEATGGADGFRSSFLPREDLVNTAATKGYLDLIGFFREHGEYFRFSPQTMHNATATNHLQIVKFQHENRTEGCKVSTLFECDKRELPHILRYLCSNRPMAKRDGQLLMAAQLEYAAKKTYAYK